MKRPYKTNEAYDIIYALSVAQDHIMTPVSMVKICVFCQGKEFDEDGIIEHTERCIFSRAKAYIKNTHRPATKKGDNP